MRLSVSRQVAARGVVLPTLCACVLGLGVF